MVSRTSTASSSKPSVEIVTLADVEPVEIKISEPLTVYSVVCCAVPDKVNGIVISEPETSEEAAVKVTVFDEFSSILSDEKANVTNGAVSLSVKVIAIAEASGNVAFDGDPGVTIIVSSNSNNESSSPVIVEIPVVSPAVIVISGNNWYILTV